MSSKNEQYRQLITQIKGLLTDETDQIANMANISAVLYDHFKHHWVGFYRVVDDQLVLGPFQGPVACTRIGFGNGVCGQAWKNNESIVVPNVHDFPGHIACSALSNSEVVVPFHDGGKVAGVLDIDSVEFDAFNESDLPFYQEICTLISS
jgi:GAF domain-containing protein